MRIRTLVSRTRLIGLAGISQTRVNAKMLDILNLNAHVQYEISMRNFSISTIPDIRFVTRKKRIKVENSLKHVSRCGVVYRRVENRWGLLGSP